MNYDQWKTASPPEYDSDGCCEECFVISQDNWKGEAEPESCSNEDCICHWTKEQHKEAAGEARYEAMRDDD